MKFFFNTLILIYSSLALAQVPTRNISSLVNSADLTLSKKDHIVAEHIINSIKMVEKGYVNNEVLSRVILDISKSKNFYNFEVYFKSIKQISTLKQSPDLISACTPYISPKETLPIEKVLERLTGNYCRERTLESILRDIEKSGTLTDLSMTFIKDHMRYFLIKKNRKNFAYFMQSISSRSEIIKKLSQNIATYSVQHEMVPSQEVLKDLVINEDITKLIQDKGLNTIKHQNVFYSEFGKLIESNYRLLDKNPNEHKVREYYTFLKNYLDLNHDHLPVSLCLTRINDLSKAIFRNGFKELSREIFEYIIKKDLKEVKEDSIFFLVWTYLSTGDSREATKIAKKYNLLKGAKHITDARLKFWMGQLLEDTDQAQEAILYYENIVSGHPLSYYAIMSVKKLQILKPESPAVKFYQNEGIKEGSTSELNLSDLGQDYLASLVRLRAWAKIDSQRFIKLELKRIKLHNLPAFLVSRPTPTQEQFRSDLHLINAHLLLESKNYLSTFKYLYQALDNKEVSFNKSLLDILYPRPYYDDLVKTLKKDDLDPIIILSLIRQESVFNPEARSPVGARGLMQLMPATAKRIKRSVRDRHLVNPAINLEVGTKYFKTLLKRYDGNLVYVLSAYNAGESRVEKWRGIYFNTDDTILKNIESIPFLETRNYVKLIFRNIFFYKLLLEQKKEVADSSALNQIFDINLGFKR